MEKVFLSDSTLGYGTRHIGGNLSENDISCARKLLNKSGVDIFEIGVLRSHSLGVHSVTFDTTLLPQVIERQSEILYAALLDSQVPILEGLAYRSIETVDVIKISITAKNKEQNFINCKRIQEKGYLLCTLVEEAGHYSPEELQSLLHEIALLQPWGCYIMDNSGILDTTSLNVIQSLFEKELPKTTIIGFHPRNNLGIAVELAEKFIENARTHQPCLDTSALGIGKGAQGLSSYETAKMVYNKHMFRYALPFLEQLNVLFDKYVEPLKKADVSIGYYSCAAARCSYLYTEYFYFLGIDCTEHGDICKELSKEEAFNFDKRVANRAIMKFRRKKLNLLIVVFPSDNGSRTIDALLFNASKELLAYGIDVLIYDSSTDDRIYAVTRNFQLDGYDNIKYKRHPENSGGTSIDEKVVAAISENLAYDYIWCMRDECIPTISNFYDDLLKAVVAKVDYIVVDAEYRNSGRFCYKEYSDCTTFFIENVQRTNILGRYIFRSNALARLLRNYPISKNTHNFWITISPLYDMSVSFTKAVLIIGKVFVYNGAASKWCFCYRNTIYIWAECWYNAISALPDIYEPYKKRVLKIDTVDFHPFHLNTMLALRASGEFNSRVYRQYKELLSIVSETVHWKFRCAALIPKVIARLLVRINEVALYKPERKMSKFFWKIYKIYYRLGR